MHKATLTLFLAPVLFTGCLSADRAGEKWDDWVADHSTCEVDDDCALVYPGCPLGCADAVSADDLEAAEAMADELISRYELPGRGCDYSCVPVGDPYCDAGACAVGEADTGY
jgi:hypothetical protein